MSYKTPHLLQKFRPFSSYTSGNTQPAYRRQAGGAIPTCHTAGATFDTYSTGLRDFSTHVGPARHPTIDGAVVSDPRPRTLELAKLWRESNVADARVGPMC